MKLWVQTLSEMISRVTGEQLHFSASTSEVVEALTNAAKVANALDQGLMYSFAKVSNAFVRISVLVFTIFPFQIRFELLKTEGAQVCGVENLKSYPQHHLSPGFYIILLSQLTYCF